MGRRRDKRRENLANGGVFGDGQPAMQERTQEHPPLQQMDDAVFETKSLHDDIMAQLPAKGLQRTLRANDGRIERGDFVLTMTGLEYVGEDLTVQQWREMGNWLNQLKDSIQWMIGDWANLGVQHIDTWVAPDGREFETRYAELLETTDYSYSTLRKFAFVSRAVPPERRRTSLTFSHHVEVAHLSEPDQEMFLDMAEPNPNDEKPRRMAVRDLREEIRKRDQITSGSVAPKPAKHKDAEASLIQTGLDFTRKPPKRNAANRKKALEIAELYRKLALELETYAQQDD